MIHWRQVFPWVSQAWPVLALIPAGLTHFIAIGAFPGETVIVNKLAGMSLQVVGGLLVLYSVNDNLGLFRSQSVASTVVAWLKAFPFIRKPIVLSAHASSASSSTAIGSVGIRHAATTVEERIAELEGMLEDLQRQLGREVQAISGRIEVVRIDLQRQMIDTSDKVADLSQRLEHATVGGFKFQALGVLLAIYGAVTSVFA